MDEKRWPVAQNEAQLQHDSDEDEALSLSDLPLIHQWRKGIENNNSNFHCEKVGEDQEFDFCALSMESEMCAADEVFFKGQILPLRHSVSSEKALLQNYDPRRRSCSISRSDSMDHYYSSRSSSISSGTSSSSTSSSATAKYNKPKLPPRIQFHSHPSPSPRLNFPSSRYAAVTHRNSVKNSSIWNVLRLGIVTPPPEIAFRDLKARSGNSGSRRSTSSNSSGGDGSKKKLRPRILGGGCRCAADAVETIAPRVVIIKRSANDDGEVAAALHRDDPKMAKKQAAKKHISHHRTFEWLKQLTVEGAADQIQS
ncbi:uncharacterized protein LOC121804126 [Salvia splendens]|uniref:uncharacterized protein LOC121804126 n=1 Tax=Salvia splendens TaxID=180675 RepID=UPI001C254A1D|nr:uncharacterized protein LOC121804126 [Salvia splendens]